MEGGATAVPVCAVRLVMVEVAVLVLVLVEVAVLVLVLVRVVVAVPVLDDAVAEPVVSVRLVIVEAVVLDALVDVSDVMLWLEVPVETRVTLPLVRKDVVVEPEVSALLATLCTAFPDSLVHVAETEAGATVKLALLNKVVNVMLEDLGVVGEVAVGVWLAG